MIISRLDLKAFGRFTDVSLDLSGGPRRFHLIYGPNESGKSTSLRAITALLFGIPHITEDNYLHANAQMRIGGLLVDESGAQLDCVRRRGRKATLRDANDDEPVDETLLEDMIGGISRDTFLTRYGLSHQELVAGGAAILSGEDDLGQILFAAGAGVGKLRQIQDELDDASSRLFTPRGTKTSINAAVRELDEKRKELRLVQRPPSEFSDLQQRIDAKRKESDEISESMHKCAARLTRMRNHEQAVPLLPRWRSCIESLKEFRSAPTLDEAFTERRRQALSDREVASTRQVELETRLAELTGRLETLPVDQAVLNHESEIQTVFQEVAARDKAERDRMGLIRNQRNTDRRLIDLLQELSIEVRGDDEHQKAESIDEAVQQLRLSDSLRGRIRELASGYEKLIAQRNDASDAVETTKRRLADTIAELEAMTAPGDPALLSNAIDSIGNPQTLIEAVSEQQEICDSHQRRCEDLLRRLSGFSGSLEKAIRLRPPSEEAMQQLTEEIRISNQALARAEEQSARLKQDLEELTRQTRKEPSQSSLPTMEQLTEARQHRDRVTDRVADALRTGEDVGQLIEQLRQSIRVSDQLADAIRMHHDQIHQRDALMERVQVLEGQVSEAESKIAAAEEARDDAQRRWSALWESCEVTADQPQRMQRWLADHEQLCEFSRQLGEGQKRLEQTRSRLGLSANRLRSVLTSVGSKKPVAAAATFQGGLFDEPPEEDLISLYDEAVALRSQWSHARQQFDTLSRRRDELAEELPLAETRFEAAQQRVEQWRDDWRRATESFVKSDHAGAREVLQMIDQITDLCNKKRERDILATRIRSIGEDELAYAARVKRLVAATSERVEDDQPPTAIAQTLYQRLQAERTALKSRETLKEQIESSQQRLAEFVAQRSACEVVLQQLCHEAGCDSPDQLPEIETSARRRSQLQADLRDLENQLSILAGDQPFEEFIDEAGNQLPGVLEVDIEQTESELNRLRDALAGVQQEIGALQHELNLMDGSSRASELLQTIQFTAGQIGRDVEEYTRSKVASLLLKRAIDHYRKANQSPVLALACDYFRELTCGEYVDLKPDYDAKGKSTLFGVRADATTVPAGSMSAGTADTLYLALRMASLEHHATRGKPIPLIIDDCMIQLDDQRSRATMKALSELSMRTQVILFTHHRHLKELAEQVLNEGEYHFHELH